MVAGGGCVILDRPLEGLSQSRPFLSAAPRSPMPGRPRTGMSCFAASAPLLGPGPPLAALAGRRGGSVSVAALCFIFVNNDEDCIKFYFRIKARELRED